MQNIFSAINYYFFFFGRQFLKTYKLQSVFSSRKPNNAIKPTDMPEPFQGSQDYKLLRLTIPEYIKQ